MKKIAILALSCIMVASVFAGCRRKPMEETKHPTTTAATTAPTVHTTQPTTAATRPSTHATQPSTHTTTPATTPEVIPGATGATNGTEATGRARGTSPRY